jgi:integrase
VAAKNRWVGRVYLGRDPSGRQLFHRVGSFRTRRERDRAVAAARLRLPEDCGCAGCKRRGRRPRTVPTCDEYVARYLTHYEQHAKPSSVETQRYRLARFAGDFAGRPLDSISRAEARDWEAPAMTVRAVGALYNYAIHEDDLPLPTNPFRGLGRPGRGRAGVDPPTPDEFAGLVDACDVHGTYAPTMRALLLFGAYTLMRPSELYALDWDHIDLGAMRIRKTRRLYRGRFDTPKTGERLVALTPPARDALALLHPSGAGPVFRSKRGRRMSQPTLARYWAAVQHKAGLHYDFYLATKHYGCWYLWTRLGLTPRAIAAQAGWTVRGTESVLRLLGVYGHHEVGALEEIDAAWRSHENIARQGGAWGTGTSGGNPVEASRTWRDHPGAAHSAATGRG